MRTYITCKRRKGTPRVALDVCRSCRYKVKCITYKKFANPQLFPD